MRVNWQGYVQVLKHEHPFSNRDGYVLAHRLIWEKYHKAMLLPWSDVHHVNGDRQDNRPENLLAMMHGKHTVITHTITETRYCSLCGRNKSCLWHRSELRKGKMLCHTCYMRRKRNALGEFI